MTNSDPSNPDPLTETDRRRQALADFLLEEARYHRSTAFQMLGQVRIQASFIVGTTTAISAAGWAANKEVDTLTTVALVLSALAVVFALRAHFPGVRGAVLVTEPDAAVGYFEVAADNTGAKRALAKDIHDSAASTHDQLTTIRGHVVIAFIFAFISFPLWVIHIAS